MESYTLVKPSPILFDMPPHIKKRIISHLPLYTDKMALRNVNKEFEGLIQAPIHDCYRFWIELVDTTAVKIVYADKEGVLSLYFVNDPLGCKVLTSRGVLVEGQAVEDPKQEAMLVNRNFMEMAGQTLLAFLGNESLVLQYLDVTVWKGEDIDTLDSTEFENCKEQLLEKIDAALEVAGCLSVRNLYYYYSGKQDDVVRVLRWLDAEYLSTFTLACDHRYDGPNEVSEIMEMPHMDDLERLVMFDLPDNKVPLEMWANYPNTGMVLNYKKLEDFPKMLRHFALSPSFESSTIQTPYSRSEIMEFLSVTLNLEWETCEQTGHKFVLFLSPYTLQQMYVGLHDKNIKVEKRGPVNVSQDEDDEDEEDPMEEDGDEEEEEEYEDEEYSMDEDEDDEYEEDPMEFSDDE